ncbi:hypothetical protein O181_086627 [Austropuccinia psidii MF-1]|uniref:Uncharacterized protein n=1 Tax=Austropuccinia psidii MF-1 TaxID=1389203 RepID=A0A9Q3IMJ0_9BASI|nr:hypothetical protein [Austropuccinia psidii MF-1]
MRQDHGKHSWPWWKEQIISKWANDSWRFKMENYFEEAICYIERDRPMSWLLNVTAMETDRELPFITNAESSNTSSARGFMEDSPNTVSNLNTAQYRCKHLYWIHQYSFTSQIQVLQSYNHGFSALKLQAVSQPQRMTLLNWCCGNPSLKPNWGQLLTPYYLWPVAPLWCSMAFWS